MAGDLAAETAVGSESALIYVWPPLEPDEWEVAKLGLAKSSAVDTDSIETLAHDSQEEDGYSVVRVPASATGRGVGKLSLLDWTGAIAGVLKRKQLRYGSKGLSFLVGFSEQLCEAEMQLCYENKLLQREGKYSLTPSQPRLNADGSQTFAYRANLYRGKRLSLLRAVVMSEIAPGMDGVVASDILVHLPEGATSLFGRGELPA